MTVVVKCGSCKGRGWNQRTILAVSDRLSDHMKDHVVTDTVKVCAPCLRCDGNGKYEAEEADDVSDE